MGALSFPGFKKVQPNCDGEEAEVDSPPAQPASPEPEGTVPSAPPDEETASSTAARDTVSPARLQSKATKEDEGGPVEVKEERSSTPHSEEPPRQEDVRVPLITVMTPQPPMDVAPDLSRSHICIPCGIPFSSLDTLRAHQTYYCSARKDKGSGPSDEEEEDKAPTVTSPHRPSVSTRIPSGSSPSLATPPAGRRSTKSSGGGGIKYLYCPLCNFRTGSQSSLLRHMSSSHETFLPPHREDSFVIIPSNPLLFISSTMVSAARELPRETPIPPRALVVLADGSLHVMTGPEKTSPGGSGCFLNPFPLLPPLPPLLSPLAHPPSTEGPSSLSESPAPSPGAPLDLRKTNNNANKAKSRVREKGPATVAKGDTLPPPNAIPPNLQPLFSTGLVLPGLQPLPRPPSEGKLSNGVHSSLSPPTPHPLKDQKEEQVLKCTDCDITWNKYENYLIHKRHYCSARLESEDGQKRDSPDLPPILSDPLSPRDDYQCPKCRIRFNSLSTLEGHQTFYCRRRSSPSDPGPRAPAPQPKKWRCPFCDTEASSMASAHRHLEKHAGQQAFRCAICSYRGNTLRGMKVHIRAHLLREDPSDEDGLLAFVLPGDAQLPGDPPPSKSHTVHDCVLCGYRSNYRGNLSRHMKLVHGATTAANNGLHQGRSDSPHNSSAEEEALSTKSGRVSRASPQSDEAGKGDDDKTEPRLTSPPAKRVKREPLMDIILGDHHRGPSLSPPTGNSKPPTPPANLKKCMQCKACGIAFTYLPNFITHKKFYCHSRPLPTSSPDTIDPDGVSPPP
ncbi:unnamed protein product [Cyprideis torosa]|uniref:Uncharacterized protein n=1 Tax=Cyprideis torosa TaxID=163714 RepID=A0A7R8WI02_9CRUS|nr:unnamed protein product [Cyprideis torosa]CAG0893915.1 unnamed protein product [Cyprideis torosa]